MIFYKHFIADYDAKTAHLSWLEDCAYQRLMRLYYRDEKPLPTDLKQVARLCRAASKAERDAVQQVLSEFFEKREDGWHNARCDEELRAADTKANQNRTNGGRGGRPPKPKPESEPSGNPDGFLRETQSEPRTEPSGNPEGTHGKPTQNLSSDVQSSESRSPSRSSPESSVSASPARSQARALEEFREIQRAYPQGTYGQENWQLAEHEILRRMGEGHSHEVLLRAAQAYHEQQIATGSVGTQFIKGPEKFFARDGKWRGPFPLPKTKAQVAQDANVDAGLAWLQQQEAVDAAR